MFINFVSEKLRRYPNIRKNIKWIYQILGWTLSDKATVSNREIKCVSSLEKEHLFGYYDKSPWNKSCEKILYLEVKDSFKTAASSEKAKIVMFDLLAEKEYILSETSAWNVQQGCMLQWIGPDHEKKIIYNDYIDGKLCSIILNIETKEKIKLQAPIYTVDRDGKNALTLDFFRLHRLRPGYGYSNQEDFTKEKKVPSGICIWKLNIISNKLESLLSYKQIIEFEKRSEMNGAEHKVNHIMINPSGTRFMFLHRWIKDKKKYTRLLTCDINGENLFNLLDEDMISHCNWKDDENILAWAHTFKDGNNYYLLKDQSSERSIFGKKKLTKDGHPSYSLDNKWIITDSYPDFKRKQSLFLCKENGEKIEEIAKIYSSLRYNNDTRCDLHPRFSPDGQYICFDAAIEKKRQVYIMKI